MSISKKIIFSSTLVALLALLAGFIGYRNMSSMGEQIEECMQSNIASAHNLFELQNELSGIDDFFVGKQQGNKCKKMLSRVSSITQELANSGYSDIIALNQVNAEYQNYYTSVKNGIEIKSSQLEISKARASKILENTIRQNDEQMRKKVSQLNISIANTNFWISLVCVLVFAMAIIFGQLIARALNKSLLSLEHSAAEILKGNFSSKVEINSNDEFGYLAKSFNHLAEGVQQKNLIERQKNEMERLNSQLKAKNESLDSFVYRVSHDLKAPLINLISLQKIFKTKVKNDIDPSSMKTMEFMEKNTFKLQETIYDLLEVTRAEINSDTSIEKINLSDVVQEVLQENGEAIEKSKTSIRINIEEEYIHFSKTNLKSIFANLITNAIKYRDEKKDNLVIIQSSRQGEFYKLIVKDNGIGIDLEKHEEKLFGMFSRFHNHVEGSGVGLYIVKKVVEEFGGTINVNSHVGEGTEFIINLPYKEIVISEERKEVVER